jgi:hypothetical protein
VIPETDPRTNHLTPMKSNRGFAHMPPVVTDYPRPGSAVRVYESSAADEDAVWIAANDDTDQDVCVHLDLDQARRFAEQIIWLCDHHWSKRSDG